MNGYLDGQYALQAEQERDFMRKVHSYVLRRQNFFSSGNTESGSDESGVQLDFLMPYITENFEILRLYIAVAVTDSIRYAFDSGAPKLICENLKKDAYAKIVRASSPDELGRIEEELIQTLAQNVRRYGVKGYSLTVQRAVEFIHNYTFQQISAKDIAAQLKVEQTHLSKQFHAEVGETITDYIRRVKIDTADYLLSQREYSVTEVADLLGYTGSYFSRVYKKQRGYSPRSASAIPDGNTAKNI